MGIWGNYCEGNVDFINNIVSEHSFVFLKPAADDNMKTRRLLNNYRVLVFSAIV